MNYTTTERIIGAAIAVHRELGPGLLESTYEVCLAAELMHRGIAFKRQVEQKITYRDTRIDCGYRLDFIIEGEVIVELKSVAKLDPIHTAKILTYLKLSGHRLGLLINFNTTPLKNGIHRLAR